MSITLSQQPDSQNLYVYPDSSIVTALTNYGVAWNHNCVDEIWYSSNEDTDYVYTTNISSVSDWYGCTDHTVETGAINYVRVVAQAKSAVYAQSNNGFFKLLFGDGTSEASSSNQVPLTTSYSKYYYTWLSRPSTGVLTWSDIDNLQIGVLCSSPSVTDNNATAVFYPNANGDEDEMTPVGDTPEYKCIDEVVADDDTTCVYHNNMLLGVYYAGLYQIPDHTTETGTINSITVCYRWKWYPNGMSGRGQIFPYLKLGSAAIFSTATYASTVQEDVWINYSYTYTSVPSTGAAWAWNDIDNLQIGFKLKSPDTDVGANAGVFVTQTYLVVNYNNSNINPEIRTTQCYAIVNYTPNPSIVTLTIPQTYEVSHSRNIERYIFNDGDYRVFDYGRSNKTFTINGTEDTNAFTKMDTLKTMTHYGSKVSVTGLNDNNINTEYMIKDFRYDMDEGTPSVYRWSLTLEEI